MFTFACSYLSINCSVVCVFVQVLWSTTQESIYETRSCVQRLSWRWKCTLVQHRLRHRGPQRRQKSTPKPETRWTFTGHVACTHVCDFSTTSVAAPRHKRPWTLQTPCNLKWSNAPFAEYSLLNSIIHAHCYNCPIVNLLRAISWLLHSWTLWARIYIFTRLHIRLLQLLTL